MTETFADCEKGKKAVANPYEDYQKTGLDKMLKLAKTLCRLVQAFEVIIRAKFPDSVPIKALLVAIANLCQLLPAADAEFAAWELNTAPVPSDPMDTGGINPDAPEAIDPEFT